MENLYIFPKGLDAECVLIVGYDPMKDSEWELCVIFRAIPEEHKVQQIRRYRRSHMNPESCEEIGEMDPEEVRIFDKLMPRFYGVALKFFKLTPIDDSLPIEQQELPLQKKT